MKWRLARAAALLLVATGLAVLPAGSAVADTIPTTHYTPITLSGVGGGLTLTHPDGGATALCRPNANALKSFSAAGLQVQDFNPTSPHFADTCNGQVVLGQDGTVFFAGQLDDFTPVIQAYKNDAVVWTHLLGCGRYHLVNSMTLGADGNLYLVTVNGDNSSGCSPSRLVGLSAVPAPMTAAPQVLVDQAVSGSVVSGGLAAYQDGLALIRRTSVQYVEYDGTASTPIEAGAWVAPYQENQGTVVASGRVFLPIRATSGETSSCTGPTDSMISGVAAYEPSGEVWEFPLPACSQVNEVRPTPSGGVVFRRHVPTPSLSEIVALNADGTLLWRYSTDRPNSSFSYWGVGFSVDLNGNVAVQENVRYEVALGWSTYHFPGVRFKLLGGNSGNVLSSFELKGDLNATHSNGYMSVDVYSGVLNARTTVNTAYLTVRHCTTYNNCQADSRLYAVEVPGVQIDYPRGALLGGQGTKSHVMAIAGDSFSAGIGSVESSQYYLEDNCWRSPNAYGSRLAEDAQVKLKLSNGSFVACSGATTAAITGTFKGEFAQSSRIPSNAKSVFLTIGGNNVQFSRLGALCIFIDCATAGYESEFDAYLAALDDDLATAYEAVAEQSPDAEIYVLGYPRLFPTSDCESTPWFAELEFARLANPGVYKENAVAAGLTPTEGEAAKGTFASITSAEISWTGDFLEDLNAEVESAVSAANVLYDDRFHFVDASAPGSPFAGHELCSGEPYFNSLDAGTPGNTFHPNAAGQQAMYQLAREALETHQPEYVLAG